MHLFLKRILILIFVSFFNFIYAIENTTKWRSNLLRHTSHKNRNIGYDNFKVNKHVDDVNINQKVVNNYKNIRSNNSRKELAKLFQIENVIYKIDTSINTRRNRRSKVVRPIKIIEIPETTIGELLNLMGKKNENFRFRDKYEGLKINQNTGVISLAEGFNLDFEKNKTLEIQVIITRLDDKTYEEEQPIKIKLIDLNDEFPVIINKPIPFLATVQSNSLAGTVVYKFLAFDRDENSILKYNMESGGEGRFTLDPDTGLLTTLGYGFHVPGKEYEIGVSVQDLAYKHIDGAHLQKKPNRKHLLEQKSGIYFLRVLVGERDPQFYESRFDISVMENTSPLTKIGEIKAISHQGRQITFELSSNLGIRSDEFSIDPRTGTIELLKSLDYEKGMQKYLLNVRAVELGRNMRTSTAEVVISIIDVNDNSPVFALSQYVIRDVAETVAIGTDLLQITATDVDSGENGRLTYKVLDDHFQIETINNIGYVKVFKRLDYDQSADHFYLFTAIAMDNGNPILTGSTMIQLSVTNVNDEDPIFLQSSEKIQVSEDTPIGTVVHVAQAFDADGDGVTYFFNGKQTKFGPFAIDPISGIITLTKHLGTYNMNSEKKDKNLNSYQRLYHLNLIAEDDGKCCSGMITRSGNGILVIEVKDINNNAPNFTDCLSYLPVVNERENVGTFVIKVTAIDLDSGTNGNVTYSIVRTSDHLEDKFKIDPMSGIITTTDIFDREAQVGVFDFALTVKAEDGGMQPLAGFCTFRIKIGDKNDNPPVFNLPHYTTSVDEKSTIGKKIKQVYASDRDTGDNGKVIYLLHSDSSGYFEVNQQTGWVTLIKPITQREQIQLEVEARDKGEPPLSTIVKMIIDVTSSSSSYPRWAEDYTLSPARVSENAPVNTIVARLKAYSSIHGGLVNYIIQPGETPEQNGTPRSFHHRIDDRTNEMIIMTYRTLDFESIPQYVLTVKCSNRVPNALHNDTRLTIEVSDENDEIPQFIGLDADSRYYMSILENLEVGSKVGVVTATDRDQYSDFRKIHFSIRSIGQDYDKFMMDKQSGLIRSLVTFDRETKSEYYITVIAEDGAPSDRPNHFPSGTPNQGEAELVIKILDSNDNPPFFKESIYTARVPENTDAGIIIISVTAEDKDDDGKLSYSIAGGNVGNAFEVMPDLGEIKVRGKLDYEAGPREYRLTYRVFDDKYTNTTLVIITVVDVNDNPPKFEHEVYNVTDVVEEDSFVSISNPKYLLTVRATDPDVDRNSIIRYSLTGRYADESIFSINEKTGEIYLLRALDRDVPEGRPVWGFNVLAHDEIYDSLDQSRFVLTRPVSLVGFSEVRVYLLDVNDNAPVFDVNRLVGRVPEHSRAGMNVLTVIATDADNGINSSISYSLKEVPKRGDQPLFTVDSTSGLITSLLNNAFDRELQSEYELVVQARDRGVPPMSSTAKVRVIIEDINDNSPKFSQPLYQAELFESFPVGASVISIFAMDGDVGFNSRLTYTLDEKDREYFYVETMAVTNTGVLRLAKIIDYELLYQTNFNLTVHVQDPSPSHRDSAQILVKILDSNDNAPEIMPSIKKLTIFENVSIGTSLFKFSANDRDQNMNQRFKFTIDRKSDLFNQFSIDGNGLVMTIKLLDREIIPMHNLHIFAIDMGDPALTGTATLQINFIDVNDNSPILAPHNEFIVSENLTPGHIFATIEAVDLDSSVNGPPFKFWLPCNGACPCPYNEYCADFSFQFLPDGGEHGHGGGVISTLKSFDREKQKIYKLPIVMSDSGSPQMTGTSTLSIIIGDINDNKHQPGYKEINVYLYTGVNGEMRNIQLGNVYAEDVDDWDLVDKSFVFVEGQEDSKYFSLDKNEGILKIARSIPEGSYTLKVRVLDNLWKREVTSTVSVNVFSVDDMALKNIASLRINGITATDVITKSKAGPGPTEYQSSKLVIFIAHLARKLNVPISNVIIAGINEKFNNIVDIFFAAHGSPYMRAEKIYAILSNNIEEISDIFYGASITMPINDCIFNGQPLTEIQFNQLTVNQFIRLSEKTESLNKQFDNILANTIFEDTEYLPLIDCQTFIYFNGTQTNTINTNASSYIGVHFNVTKKIHTFTDDDEQNINNCLSEKAKKNYCFNNICSSSYCFNGGSCVQNGNTQRCICPGNFLGPQCQQTKVYMESLTSHAWVGRVQSTYGTNHLTFELLTTMENGTILMIGAKKVYHQNLLIPQNFLLVGLEGGHPFIHFLLIDHDSTLENNELQLITEYKMADSNWHRFDLFISKENVSIVLDQCQLLKTQNTKCLFTSKLPNNFWKGFDGSLILGDGDNGKTSLVSCIKNLYFNYELFDLQIDQTVYYHQMSNQCPHFLQNLCYNNNDLNVCPANLNCNSNNLAMNLIEDSDNGYICDCPNGFTGSKCDHEAPSVTFNRNGFIEWKLSDQVRNIKKSLTELSVMFRTRRTSGIILSTKDDFMTVQLKLEIKESRIQFCLFMESICKLSLTIGRVNVSDGAWHHVKISILFPGPWVELSLDGGGVRTHFNQSYYRFLSSDLVDNKITYDKRNSEYKENAEWLNIGQFGLIAGADLNMEVNYGEGNNINFENDFNGGCIKDVRLNKYQLPLTPTSEISKNIAQISDRSQNYEMGCFSTACLDVMCPQPLKCVDKWRQALCSCPNGYQADTSTDLSGNEIITCLPIDECISEPCLRGGTCIDFPDGYVCQCKGEFGGERCENKLAVFGERETRITFTLCALFAIILCVISLAVLICVYICVIRRRQKQSSSYPDVCDVDIRENIIHYDDEGVGELDQDRYNIEELKHAYRNGMYFRQQKNAISDTGMPYSRSQLASMLTSRVKMLEQNETFQPYDSVREYNYEDQPCFGGSLSSLGSIKPGQRDPDL